LIVYESIINSITAPTKSASYDFATRELLTSRRAPLVYASVFFWDV